jgi:hypothetical protein
LLIPIRLALHTDAEGQRDQVVVLVALGNGIVTINPGIDDMVATAGGEGMGTDGCQQCSSLRRDQAPG